MQWHPCAGHSQAAEVKSSLCHGDLFSHMLTSFLRYPQSLSDRLSLYHPSDTPCPSDLGSFLTCQERGRGCHCQSVPTVVSTNPWDVIFRLRIRTWRVSRLYSLESRCRRGPSPPLPSNPCVITKFQWRMWPADDNSLLYKVLDVQVVGASGWRCPKRSLSSESRTGLGLLNACPLKTQGKEKNLVNNSFISQIEVCNWLMLGL